MMDDEVLEELFTAVGPIGIRRLFGGQGIYAEGMIVAIVFRGEVMLKVDAFSEPSFQAAGSIRWCYTRAGRAPVAMPYFSLPDDAFDDPDIAAHWVRMALEAAQRASAVTSISRPERLGKNTNRN